MIEKEFDAIEKADIEALVTDIIREARTIEYKLQTPARGEEGKKEFLADVSSFANASGGDLIFGVEEDRDTGNPKAVVGVEDSNADQTIQRLEHILRSGVEPRISGVQTKAVDGFPKGPAILMRIPKSWSGPHMIKGGPRFFSRTSNGKAPLDLPEIRALFLNAAHIPERIRRFREQRLGDILAGETPVPLSPDSLTVLHLVPVSTFSSGQLMSVQPFIRRDCYLAMLRSGGSMRPNSDGYLRYGTTRNSKGAAVGNYSQFFRNGAVEAVVDMGTRDQEDETRSIPSGSFEKEIVEGVESLLRMYRTMKVYGPIVVLLSLLRVRDCFIGYSAGQDVHTINRDHLVLPDFILDDANVDVPTALQPLFDIVWQASGFSESHNYTGPGEWSPNR